MTTRSGKILTLHMRSLRERHRLDAPSNQWRIGFWPEQRVVKARWIACDAEVGNVGRDDLVFALASNMKRSVAGLADLIEVNDGWPVERDRIPEMAGPHEDARNTRNGVP